MDKRGWLTVAVLLALSALLRHSLLFLMGLLLGLVGGASWLWTRYCLAGVSYRRLLGTTCLFHGEETDLYLEVTNAKPLPLAWVRVEDQFPAAVELIGGRLYPFVADRQRLVHLFSLRWYERVRRHYRLRGAHRGVWPFGPASVVSGDVFGLGLKRAGAPEVQTLMVYPRFIPITALGLPAGHPFGDLRTRQRVLADPLRLMGARDYRPGDSFRHIHWKTTARRQMLHTKVYEPSASKPLAIFLNVNTFEFLYEGLDAELQEFAITAAASIARHAHEAGSPVGLYVNSVCWPRGERIRIRPGNHPDQIVRIFQALAGVAQYGRWPVEAVLAVELRGLPYGATVVVISPVVNDGLVRTLAEVRRHACGAVLVTLGDTPPESPMPGVTCFHIGGREVWHELETLELAR